MTLNISDGEKSGLRWSEAVISPPEAVAGDKNMKTTEQKKSSGILRRQKKIDEWNFPYTANFYMGCPYQCKYCYTQQFPFSQHVEFGTELKIKLDAPVRIRKELERLKGIESKFKEVQVGNTWDVYQPAERKYRLTRQCLEVFMDYPEWKIHLVTRSPIILDDLDLLAKMPKLEVEFTIAVIKDYRKFEPGSPSIEQRLEAIKALSDAGIFVRIMIMPIIPGYTNVDEIISIGKDHGAKDFKQKELNYTTVEKMLE